jgi:hypothetical protein
MDYTNDTQHENSIQEAAAPVLDPVQVNCDDITQSHIDTLNKLSQFASASSSAFACGGIIPESDVPLKDVMLFICGNGM